MGDNDATKAEAAGTQPPGHPLDPGKAPASLSERRPDLARSS